VLRYIKIENIANVLKELKVAGLTTFQTGADNTRNTVADPLDGLAYDSIVETKSIVDRLEKRFIENPKWVSTLPRKFNTGILGSLSNSCNIFGHDCCFVLAQKDGEFGFNIFLGARVGVQAKDANLFVTAEEIPTFYEALLTVFKKYGYRDNRNKNRLHFLLQDVGINAVIEAVKKEAGISFLEAGITMVQSQNIALGSNKVLLKDGTFAYKLIVPSGIFSGTDMIEAAKTANTFGSGNIRLTYDQNLYMINVPRENMDTLEDSKLIKKYAQYHNLYFQDMIACAGTNTCSFAVIPNKADAIEMAHFLNSEVPLQNAVIRMNWSACPKGCGVHGIADIGFEGCKAKDNEGNRVDGVHIFLGGKITRVAKEARLLHKTLPITEAKHHVKYLLKTYASMKQRAETFEAFEERYLGANYSYQALGFYTKINYILQDKLGLDVNFELAKEPKTYKKEEFELFDFGLRLFKLLTGEKRYEAVENFQIVKTDMRKIKRDEVSKLNPQIPEKLSEVIYNMTHQDKRERAQVFSELLMALKEV
ncbi:MAG: ferredoxin--nitrite reductase, partial [Sulfurovum sp.]|nr:ferredoxin--nitrite reductase [Sulfurovum sp.]